MKFSRSEKLLLIAGALAIVHHIDHVLRVDHSGWPFVPRVSPFTFSLLVYPLFLFVLLVRTKPWFRVAVTGFLFVGTSLTHAFIETPVDEYRTWAYGSNFPGQVGQHNLTGRDSVFLGVCAAIVTLLLSVALFAALRAFVQDAQRSDNGHRENRPTVPSKPNEFIDDYRNS